jgi:hypothetical protein
VSNIDPLTNPDRVVMEDGKRVRLYHCAGGLWLSRREALQRRVVQGGGVEWAPPPSTPPAITITEAGEITVMVVLGITVDPMAWVTNFGVEPHQVPNDVETYVVGQVEEQLRHAVDDSIRVVAGARR